MPIIKTYYKVHRVFPDPDYFYMENTSGSTGAFLIMKSGTPATTDLSYSLDKVTWTDIHNGGTISNVPNNGKVYLRSTTGLSSSSGYISIKGGNNQYAAGTSYNVGGHISTLVNYTNVNSITTIPDNNFRRLFGSSTTDSGLVHANIDLFGIKTIESNAFEHTFQYNRNLITIPDFSGIETVGSYGMQSMLEGCTSLTVPVDLSGITSVAAASMGALYDGCSSLVEAIAPNISTWDNSTFNYWLNGVASTGVVRKPAGLTIPTDSASGVPTGWTTENY